MNSRTLILEAARRMEEAGIPDPRVDASLLLSRIAGMPPLELRMGMPIDESAAEKLRSMVDQRLTRRPLQYILGDQPFCGRSFRVDERVLIPRPETELLAEMAAAWLRSRGGSPTQVLDLCCGSGCIGITLALEIPGSTVTLSDLSPDALACARENAESLKAPVSFLQSDLFDAMPSRRFDLIVSNPPYIPTADCMTLQPEVRREPMLALDGGTDGLELYRRIARESRDHLLPHGRLMLEIGIGEEDGICALLREAGYTDISVHRDLNGIHRMISAG